MKVLSGTTVHSITTIVFKCPIRVVSNRDRRMPIGDNGNAMCTVESRSSKEYQASSTTFTQNCESDRGASNYNSRVGQFAFESVNDSSRGKEIARDTAAGTVTRYGSFTVNQTHSISTDLSMSLRISSVVMPSLPRAFTEIEKHTARLTQR